MLQQSVRRAIRPWKLTNTRRMSEQAAVATKLLPEWMESVFVPIGDDTRIHTVKSTCPSSSSPSTPPILCLPCAFGSVIHNFQPQFHGLGQSFEWIGIDPRGYGYSRPPERTFPSNYFEQDAQDVIRIMDTLGHDTCTILGWSAGANVGAVLASMFPDRVHRLIMVNGNAFIDDDDLDIMDKYEDVSTWHPVACEQGTMVYGSEPFHAGWSRLLSTHRLLYEQQNGDLYCHHLPQIQCKTLVIGSGNDPFVPLFHAEYLSERIMHSRLHLFPNGRHDVHLQNATAFNQLIETFVHEPNDQQTQSREYVARPE